MSIMTCYHLLKDLGKIMLESIGKKVEIVKAKLFAFIAIAG
jgi:hypothetical protein